MDEDCMSENELFIKYSINESHSQWEPMIDTWNGVEIYKIMKGKLPDLEDKDTLYILKFLDKCNNDFMFTREVSNFGSMYLTAKRSVFRFSDKILEQLNERTK